MTQQQPDGVAAWLKLVGAVAGLAFWGVVMWVVIGACSSSYDAASVPTDTDTSTAEQPRPHEAMPGDGTYRMGGISGKDWGVWESSGAPTACEWSIRATSPYAAAQILDTGAAPAGESARVSIQPFSDASAFTGEIDGSRVVFMTNGCGAWSLAP